MKCSLTTKVTLAVVALSLMMGMLGWIVWSIKHRPTAAQRFGCEKTYVNAKGEDTGECE